MNEEELVDVSWVTTESSHKEWPTWAKFVFICFLSLIPMLGGLVVWALLTQ